MRNPMSLINLTPHPVRLEGFISGLDTIEPSGEIARVEVEEEFLGLFEVEELSHQPVALYQEGAGKVSGLPETSPGTYYIVSRFVAQACPDRDDLLVPTKLVRDESGRITGAKGLALIR